MALGCLGMLALAAAVGVLALQYLPLPRSGSPTPPRLFAALIGVLGGLGLGSAISLVLGHGRGANSLQPLLARAKTDGPAEDGGLIIATGTVRSDAPLVSPIGGVPCVAYDYRMVRQATRSDSDDEPVPVYWGYASQPFSIDGRARRYAVSAAGLQAEHATRADDAEAKRRARDYIRSTRWETVEYRMLGALDTVKQRLADIAPGGTRKDFAADGNGPIDVALLEVEENALPVGATASAFGAWSASYGMIVAPPSPLPGSHVVLVEGGPDALKGRPGVPQSTTAGVVGTIALIALAAGFFWLAIVVLPTFRT